MSTKSVFKGVAINGIKEPIPELKAIFINDCESG
jgi:hypothetical protein